MPDDPRNPAESSTGFSPSMRIGGIPAWAWIGVAAVGAGVWFYSRRSSTEEPAATNTITVPGVDATDVQGQLATINAQIRDLQGSGSSAGAPSGNVPTPGVYVQLPTPAASTGPHTTGPLPANTSLESLAVKYWGDASLARWLYWTNHDLIESAAKRAGHSDSNGGTFLAPGVNLDVPPKPTTQQLMGGTS